MTNLQGFKKSKRRYEMQTWWFLNRFYSWEYYMYIQGNNNNNNNSSILEYVVFSKKFWEFILIVVCTKHLLNLLLSLGPHTQQQTVYCLFWHQYRAFFIIYKLTNNCTFISNTIITITCSYMLRHLRCHPQGAHCALLKLHTDFLVLVK